MPIKNATFCIITFNVCMTFCRMPLLLSVAIMAFMFSVNVARVEVAMFWLVQKLDYFRNCISCTVAVNLTH
jgi:hypothetical protein